MPFNQSVRPQNMKAAIEELDPGIENENIDGDGAISDPFDPTKIRVERSNPTIDLITRRIRDGAINLAPDFQRKGGIWTDEAQSRLIESILIRIPLPAFYVDATDEDRWLIVDGLQRLSTLRRFIIDGNLSLRGLEFLQHLHNKTFKDLPRNLQRRLEETEVTVFLIQPGTPPEVKFNIFKRINTGGLPLSAQEIRNAINGNRVRRFIHKLTDMESFKDATGGALSSKRMADRECVVRFLAFSLTQPQEYKGRDFDAFLNGVMQAIDSQSKVPNAKLRDLATSFDSSMLAAKKIFGDQAFRKYFGDQTRRFPINKALFESVSYNLSLLGKNEIGALEHKQDIVLTKLAELHKNEIFLASISQGTGAPARIHCRFKSIRNLLMEALDNAEKY